MLFIIALSALLAQRLRTLLFYFQREEYDGRRFLISWREVKLYDVRATLAVLIEGLLVFLGISLSLALVGLAWLLVLISFTEINRNLHAQFLSILEWHLGSCFQIHSLPRKDQLVLDLPFMGKSIPCVLSAQVRSFPIWNTVISEPSGISGVDSQFLPEE